MNEKEESFQQFVDAWIAEAEQEQFKEDGYVDEEENDNRSFEAGFYYPI